MILKKFLYAYLNGKSPSNRNHLLKEWIYSQKIAISYGAGESRVVSSRCTFFILKSPVLGINSVVSFNQLYTLVLSLGNDFNSYGWFLSN